MPAFAFEVVHVGSASRDVTSDDPRGWRLGGGVSYAALTTARLGIRTAALIGVDDVTASATELELLRGAGVAIRLADVAQAPVFRNQESAGGRVQTLLASASPLELHHLPDAWRTANAWSLVPVADELVSEWAQIDDQAVVALGWQGLLRALVAGAVVTRRDPTPTPLVARADLVGVSKQDLAPETDVLGLLDMLRPGARLLVTDGPRGGHVLRRLQSGDLETWAYEAVPAARTTDPTGAGDVYLAALLAITVRPDLTRQLPGRSQDLDLRFAASVASFVVEAPGLHGVPTLAAARERLSRT